MDGKKIALMIMAFCVIALSANFGYVHGRTAKADIYANFANIDARLDRLESIMGSKDQIILALRTDVERLKESKKTSEEDIQIILKKIADIEGKLSDMNTYQPLVKTELFNLPLRKWTCDGQHGIDGRKTDCRLI